MLKDPDNLPELNLRVILIGIALSVVMGSANVYLGLKAGMTVSASIPAAVIGMLTLRYFNKFFKNSKKRKFLQTWPPNFECFLNT